MKKHLFVIFSILFLVIYPEYVSLSNPADSIKSVQRLFPVLNPIKELQADLEGILDNPDFANA